MDETENKMKRSAVLSSRLQFDDKRYEYIEDWVPADQSNPLDIHSTGELVQYLKEHADDPNVQLEARVCGIHKGGRAVSAMSKRDFLEAAK